MRWKNHIRTRRGPKVLRMGGLRRVKYFRMVFSCIYSSVSPQNRTHSCRLTRAWRGRTLTKPDACLPPPRVCEQPHPGAYARLQRRPATPKTLGAILGDRANSAPFKNTRLRYRQLYSICVQQLPQSTQRIPRNHRSADFLDTVFLRTYIKNYY
jgi:hypothetical protein